jgi:hypothetical protein
LKALKRGLGVGEEEKERSPSSEVDELEVRNTV